MINLRPVDVIVNETPMQRWQALMDKAGAPFQQSWTYGAVAAQLGASVNRIEVRADGETIALAQGVERWCLRPLTLITMGPVWMGDVDAPTQAEVIRAMRAQLDGALIVTAPDADSGAPCKAAGLKDVMTPATLADLALGEELRSRMTVKWRNRLTRAESAGLRVHRTKSLSHLEWLLRADRAQQKRRRYRALPAVFTRAWVDSAPKSVLHLTAGPPDDPIAAMLFLTHGTGATYHIGWTSAAGRAQSAHNLILAEGAARLARQGVRRLNLGLIDTETAPGLARFKLGAGARPIRTGGTWLGWSW